MLGLIEHLKLIVAATCLAIGISVPSQVIAQDVNTLLDQLAQSNPAAAERKADEIRRAWAQSGSASADLLLQRGRDALERGEVQTAIEHFTALTDHAPDFAEGWHGRANAYFVAGLVGPAVADLEQALALNPKHFDALRGLAAILEQLDRPKQAYEAYVLYDTIHPHQADVTEAIKRLEALVKGQTL